VFFGLTAQAQQKTTTTGGVASGAGGTSSYSVGLIDYKTSTGPGGSSAQGVQHAYEIFTLDVDGSAALSSAIFVFPNPTTDSLNLQLSTISAEPLSYQLFDANGRLLQQNAINDLRTQINMSSFSSATYIIQVTQGDQKIKSFKIIKNKPP